MSLPASTPPSRLISDELRALVEPLIPSQPPAVHGHTGVLTCSVPACEGRAAASRSGRPGSVMGRPAPPPAPVRLLNAVGRRSGHRGRLDAEEMLWDARRRTGLADLGPDTDQAYRLLIDAVDREARLTTLGRVVVGRLVRGYLAQRR